MKRSLLLAGLLFLLVSNAKADNVGSYFTMGVNDTLYINPNFCGRLYENLPVTALFDNRFDSWTVTMTLPNGLKNEQSRRGSGMNLHFVNSQGVDSIYEAILTDNDSCRVFESTILEPGYWDPDQDGVYESYGAIKWEPAEYDSIFLIDMRVYNYFRQGIVTLSGEMTCTGDLRDSIYTTTETFTRNIFIKVGYRLGDANGDGYIDTDDVSLIIKFIMGQRTPDEFQFEASDVNEDGVLDAGDVALLIRWVLGMSSTQDIDIEDYI